MYLLTIMLILIAFEDIKTADEPAITDGTRFATEGEFPFVGLMIEIDMFKCGVVIITETVIGTAAHCFIRWDWDGRQSFVDLSSTSVLLGSLTHGDGISGRIKDYKVPSNYKPKTNGGHLADIGIANLEKAITVSNRIKPATFVSKDSVAYRNAWDELVESGKPCYSIGWEVIEAAKRGDMTYHKIYSDLLKVTTVKPWNDKDCSASMPDKESDIVPFGGVCASAIPTNYKSLAGDEGGALYCDGHLYAVLSTLRVDVESEKPAQFYLFDSYLNEYYTEVTPNNTLSTSPVEYPTKSLFFMPPFLLYISTFAGAH